MMTEPMPAATKAGLLRDLRAAKQRARLLGNDLEPLSKRLAALNFATCAREMAEMPTKLGSVELYIRTAENHVAACPSDKE